MAALLKLTGLRWPELIRAIWRGSVETNVTNRAAELAFWFLLGFFPMLLFRYRHGVDDWLGAWFASTLITYVGEVLPSGASSLVRQVLAQTTGSGRAWFSLLFAVWSSSSATSGLIDTLNAIYALKESRPWWKCRLIAVGLAVAMGVLLTAALIIVVYGPLLLDKISPGSAALYVWKIAQWPAAAVLLILALLGLYRFAPNLQNKNGSGCCPEAWLRL